MWLKRPEIAHLVEDAMHYAAKDLQYLDLHSYVILPNHVHMLIWPRVDPRKLLQSVKRYSARQANKILRRAREPFWQGECYDHWVRNDGEFARVCRYIENNPVRAGLAAKPEDYRWSNAYAGMNAVAAG